MQLQLVTVALYPETGEFPAAPMPGIEGEMPGAETLRLGGGAVRVPAGPFSSRRS